VIKQKHRTSLSQEFHSVYETPKFIALFTRAFNWTLSHPSWIQSTPFLLLRCFPYSTPVRFPSGRVLTRYLTSILKKKNFHPLQASFIPSISCAFGFIFLIRIRDEEPANYKARKCAQFGVFMLQRTFWGRIFSSELLCYTSSLFDFLLGKETMFSAYKVKTCTGTSITYFSS
jgi:hypothetical protein